MASMGSMFISFFENAKAKFNNWSDLPVNICTLTKYALSTNQSARYIGNFIIKVSIMSAPMDSVKSTEKDHPEVHFKFGPQDVQPAKYWQEWRYFVHALFEACFRVSKKV